MEKQNWKLKNNKNNKTEYDDSSKLMNVFNAVTEASPYCQNEFTAFFVLEQADNFYSGTKRDACAVAKFSEVRTDLKIGIVSRISYACDNMLSLNKGSHTSV